MKSYILTTLFLLICAPAWAQSDFASYLGQQNPYQEVKVIEVISADTIRLEDKKKIKLIGLKAPEPPELDENVERNQYGFEMKKQRSPITPIEEEAFFFVKNLLEGKSIRVEFDANRNIGEYKTTPGYIYLLKEGTFINEEILRRGYSFLQIRPPNTKYSKKLRAAYREAREEKRGLHNQ